MRLFQLALLTAALFFCVINCDLRFNDARFSNRTQYAAQMFHPDATTLFNPVTGPLIWSGATNNYSGYIVHFRELDKPVFWQTARDLQRQGAIGIISETESRVAGRGFCTYNKEDYLEELTIPFVSISLYGWEDVIELLTQGEIVNITLSSDGNAWYDMYYSPAFTGLFRGMLGAISAALTVYAAVILGFFIRIQGSQFNIPQVCLGLEVIANIRKFEKAFKAVLRFPVRLLYIAVDPFGCYFNLQTITTNILATLTLPFNVATFALITFYWYEAINEASIAIYPFLTKLQIPFFVVTFLLIAMEFVTSLLNYFLGLSDRMSRLIIYLLIQLGFLIFYVVTILKIGKKLQKSAELTSGKKSNALKKINKKMILGGIAKLVLVIYAVIWASLSLTDIPIPGVVLYALLYLFLMVDSFCRIYLFNVKKAAKTSSRHTNTATKPVSEVHDESKVVS